VTVLQSGSLAPLVRASRGLITINSTSGVTAIEAGVPTLVLGDTFYRVPGLATSADDPHEMDSFWTSPPKPDAALAERFVARIRADALPAGVLLRPDDLGPALRSRRPAGPVGDARPRAPAAAAGHRAVDPPPGRAGGSRAGCGASRLAAVVPSRSPPVRGLDPAE
jgi:hypothetical protein